MKSFKQYLLEEYNAYRCKNLNVVFKIRYNGENIISFKIPASYSEDNFQIYIQDLYLNSLPGNTFKTKDTLKNNLSNLFDTYFEYDTYEKTSDEPNDFIDWKSSYDEHISDNDNFDYVNIENLRYIMHFDSFDLNSETEEKIKEDLDIIFESMSIKNDDDLPFDVIYVKDKLDYE